MSATLSRFENRGHVNSRASGGTTWNKIWFYARFLWRFVLLQKPEPLIYGIALTDRCNFNCLGCRVANTGRPDMTWEQLLSLMQNAWKRGFRELYFTGGEPMLWRSAGHTLKEVITAARQIGFFHIHVYTNSTHGLESSADLNWVSMDGLPATFELRRGQHFGQVEATLRSNANIKTAVIYVIDQNTRDGIEPFLRWVQQTRLPTLGVMFYFHTPYYGRDELFLNAAERAVIIDRLLASIRAGLPVLNSSAGLRALKSGNWPRRLAVARVVDVEGESICCRASDEVCADCGYAVCTEITECQQFHLNAVFRMLRYW